MPTDLPRTIREQFVCVVVHHVNHSLPDGELERFRELAWAVPCSGRDGQLREITDAAELVKFAAAESAIPLSALDRLGTPTIAGAVDDIPVLVWPESGVYAMPLDNHKTLIVWLSEPAYPPGW